MNLVASEVVFSDFGGSVFIGWFSRAFPEGNLSGDLSGDLLVDGSAFLFRDILVSGEGNILALIHMNVFASIVGWLPFLVLAVIKVFLLGIIKTDPFIFAFLFVSSVTFSFGILDWYLDIFAFFLIDFFVASFVDCFPDNFAFWIASLKGLLVSREVVAMTILRGSRGNSGHGQEGECEGVHVDCWFQLVIEKWVCKLLIANWCWIVLEWRVLYIFLSIPAAHQVARKAMHCMGIPRLLAPELACWHSALHWLLLGGFPIKICGYFGAYSGWKPRHFWNQHLSFCLLGRKKSPIWRTKGISERVKTQGVFPSRIKFSSCSWKIISIICLKKWICWFTDVE